MAKNIPAENLGTFQRFPILILLGYIPPIWVVGFVIFGVLSIIGAVLGAFLMSVADSLSFHEVLTWPSVLYMEAQRKKAERVIVKYQRKLNSF